MTISEFPRLKLLIGLARERIRGDMLANETQHYDEADCDGYCLADDLEASVDQAERELNPPGLPDGEWETVVLRVKKDPDVSMPPGAIQYRGEMYYLRKGKS